jgi:hypothetical protein
MFFEAGRKIGGAVKTYVISYFCIDRVIEGSPREYSETT